MGCIQQTETMSKYAASQVDLKNENLPWTRIFRLVRSGSRVLEFGCSSGYFSRVLAEEKGCRVTGLEREEGPALEARRWCHRVIVGDAELIRWEDELGDARFDHILFGDFLEHLRDPAGLLRRVLPFLDSGGDLLASIPNIAHVSIRLDLLCGRFRYGPLGILDDTHLRFFTRETLIELLAECGLVVDHLDATLQELPEEVIRESLESAGVSADQSALAALSSEEALAYQFVVRARRVPPGTSVDKIVSSAPALRISEKRWQERMSEKDGEIAVLHGKLHQSEVGREENRQEALRALERAEDLDRGRKEERIRREALDRALRESKERMEDLRRALADEMERASLLEETVREAERRSERFADLARERAVALARIHESHGWKALRAYYRMRDAALPPGSHRRGLAKLLFHALRNPALLSRLRSFSAIKEELESIREEERGAMGLEVVVDTADRGTSILIHCDAASLAGDRLEVSGWALSPSGTDRVRVLLDGEPVGEALIGQPRADVHAAFPEMRGSDCAGFYANIRLLDDDKTSARRMLRVIVEDGEKRTRGANIPIRRWDPLGEHLARTSPDDGEWKWMARRGAGLPYLPELGLVVLPRSKEPDFPEETCLSVARQAYPAVCFLPEREGAPAAPTSPSRAALIALGRTRTVPIRNDSIRIDDLDSEWIGWIRPGTVLRPQALFEIALRLNEDRDLDLVFWDEFIDDKGKPKEAVLHPGWSPDLLAGMNYIGSAFVARRDLFRRAGIRDVNAHGPGFLDLLLRLTKNADRVGHVPSILSSLPAGLPEETMSGSRTEGMPMGRPLEQGDTRTLEEGGSSRVRQDAPKTARVNVIVPTAYRRPDEVLRCLRSIADKTTYGNHEILLIDNSRGSLSEEDSVRLTSEVAGLRVIRQDAPFNYSRLNNAAVAGAEGDYLVFLNDDTEVETPEWIELMLEHASRPEVGVVGAKLLYDDGRIQHGGVFLVDHGGGGRHAFRFLRGEEPGYRGFARVVRNCSAVTFACAMVRREVFEKLGGLDEDLAVECNDIDFCLRAREAGFLVVWTPFAVLRHNELTTRGARNHDADVALLWQKWRSVLEGGDPLYHPLLTLDADDWSFNPRPVLTQHCGPFLTAWPGESADSRPGFDPLSIRRILVVKLDHIGDVILSLPAVKLLKRRYPNAEITMLVGPWAKRFVQSIPEVSRVLVHDFFAERSEEGVHAATKAELDRLRETLDGFSFDLAIDLRRHEQTRGVLGLAGARFTAGYRTSGDDRGLTFAIDVPPSVEDRPGQAIKPHIVDQLLRLVRAIPPATTEGDDFDPENLIEIELPTDRDAASGHVALRDSEFLVGLHPAVGSSIRQWPARSFARLADLLVERHGARVVLFGAEAERGIADKVLRNMRHRDRAESLAGKISLGGFLEVVRWCDLFVGNISGPCHIAGALGIPTLTVFAGQVSPREWHPLGARTLSVRVDVACSPCYKALPGDCPYDLKCLKTLPAEKVYEAARRLLILSTTKEAGVGSR